MTPLLSILTISCLSRMCGGGLYGDRMRPSWLPELLFGAAIGCGLYAHHSAPYAVLSALWCALWMRTGHGTAYTMGRDPSEAQSGRKQFLSPVIDKLAGYLNFVPGEKEYCWMFMGVKGALIGVPLGSHGMLLYLLWPLCYEINYLLYERFGSRFHVHRIAEYMTGSVVGLIVVYGG